MTPPTIARVLRFDGFRRTVSDLSRAIDFYCSALGFECRSEICEVPGTGSPGEPSSPARSAMLTLGNESIELYAPAGSEGRAGLQARACGIDSVGFQHIAIVAGDMTEAFRRLQRFSPTPISTNGPVRLPASAGRVTAWKFRDIEGHPLELISFPAGTGDPKWHRAAPQRTTMGIDHSAIAVADVERSLAFYVDALGFELASREINHGPGQDALDGAVGVHVEVVGLKANGSPTPHLELLGYRAPRPQTRRPWMTDIDTLTDQLAWVVDAPEASRDEQLMRDPDGHLVVLRERVSAP